MAVSNDFINNNIIFGIICKIKSIAFRGKSYGNAGWGTAWPVLVCCESCTKDGGRPSGRGWSGRPAKQPSAAVVKSYGSERWRKSPWNGHVSFMKMKRKWTADEVSIAWSDVKTYLPPPDRDKSRGKSWIRLLGIRHEGGMSIEQALVWNVGTWALMKIEKVQDTESQGRK